MSTTSTALAILVPLLVIFILTVITTILQRRSKDACLKRLHRRFVYLQLKSEKWCWGELHVFAKSLELAYEKPNPDAKGHHELSYVLFEDMLPQIYIVLRPHPPANTSELLRWRAELRKIISPSIWAHIRRSLRNIFNTLRDATAQSIGLIVGQLRTRNPAFLMGADQKLATTGQLIASYGNNAYEPVLDKYLGKCVVLELLSGNQWLEQLGILEEYTDKYILLRNVKLHPSTPVPPGFSASQRMDAAFPRLHSVVRHLASMEEADRL